MSEESQATKPARAKNVVDSTMPLVAIMVVGVVLRLVFLGRDNLFFDEFYSVWVARLPLAEMLAESLAAGHPPLYHLLTRVWFVFGEGEFWIRSFSALSGAALIWFTFLLGRELFSRRAGLWAASMTAVAPMLVWHARSATFYSMLFALTTLSFFLLLRAMRSGRGRDWVAYTAAMVAVYLTSFFAAVLQLAAVAVFLVLRRRSERVMPFLLTQALLGATALTAFYATRFSVAEDTSSLYMPPLSSSTVIIKRILTAPLFLIAGDPGSGTDRIAGLLHSWGGGISGSKAMLGLAALVLVATFCLLVYRWPSPFGRGLLAMAAASAIIVVLTLFFAYINGEQLTSRFIAWAAPLVLVAVAAVLADTGRRVQAAAGILVLAILLTLNVWGLWVVPRAQGYIADLAPVLVDGYRDGDLVYSATLNNETMVVAYYLPQAPPPVGGFPASDAKMYFLPPGEVWDGYRSGYWVGTGKTAPVEGRAITERVAADVSDAGRVWLVIPISFEEEYPEVETGLRASHELKQEWRFEPVKLCLYEREAGDGS